MKQQGLASHIGRVPDVVDITTTPAAKACFVRGIVLMARSRYEPSEKSAERHVLDQEAGKTWGPPLLLGDVRALSSRRASGDLTTSASATQKQPMAVAAVS